MISLQGMKCVDQKKYPWLGNIMNLILFTEPGQFAARIQTFLERNGVSSTMISVTQREDSTYHWKPESIFSIRELVLNLQNSDESYDGVLFVPAQIPHTMEQPSQIRELSERWSTGFIFLITELNKYLPQSNHFYFLDYPQHNFFSRLHQATLRCLAEDFFTSEDTRKSYGYTFTDTGDDQVESFLKLFKDPKKNQPGLWQKLGRRSLF